MKNSGGLRVVETKDFLNYEGKKQAEFLLPMSERKAEIDKLFDSDPEDLGYQFPWSKTHGKVYMGKGEVSILAGVNGNGKSLITSQMALHVARTHRVLMASMEMPIAIQARRMLKQASGTLNPTKQYRDGVIDALDGRIWFYEQIRTVKPHEMISLVDYAIHELDINLIFIDSMMKCGISTEDYNGQKNFLDALCAVVKNSSAHVCLVHHVRKGDVQKIPTKWDIKGAGEITDMCDQVFICHRDKVLENKIKNPALSDAEREELMKLPTQKLVIEKNRNQDFEGTLHLWFHPSGQYTADHRRQAIPWRGVVEV